MAFLAFSCSSFLDNEPPDPAPISSVKLNPAQDINTYQITLSWDKSLDVQFAAYLVYFDTIPGVTAQSNLAGSLIFRDSTHFILTDLDSDKNYYARVFVRSGNVSSGSNEISFKTKPCSAGVFTGERDVATGMVLIPAGCFSDSGSYIANVSTPFYMDTSEVTLGRFREVMDGVADSSRKPVAYKTFYEIIQFCNKLSKLKGRDSCYLYESLSATKASNLKCDFTRNGFRLPTEDEWEYAYRAGSATDFYWGQDCTIPAKGKTGCGNLDSLKINSYEWWSGNNQPNGAKPVASKSPNKFGLYDMGGNLMEMVWDYEQSVTILRQRLKDRTDFRGLPKGDVHILRGGSYQDAAEKLSANTRIFVKDNVSRVDMGFRVVATKVGN